MLKRLMEALNLDADGAVRRVEFDQAPVPDVLFSPLEREAMERFLFNATNSTFRYIDKSGKNGIVFYDDRGRAACGIIRDMDDGLLLGLAQRKGYKFQSVG